MEIPETGVSSGGAFYHGQINDMGRLARSLAMSGMPLEDACHALAILRGMDEAEAAKLHETTSNLSGAEFIGGRGGAERRGVVPEEYRNRV